MTVEVEQTPVVLGAVLPSPAKRVECEISDVAVVPEDGVMEAKPFEGLGS